jgi:hypothetical protein
MRDFTLITYKRLLQALVASGYSFQTLQGFIRQPADKAVIFRHDIDRLPQNALTIARLEKSMDVNSSYYFRAVPESFDEYIIKEIAELGHEIGYHYESLSLCRGNYESAIKNFESDLKRFREIYPVKTICMHGSPLSKWDNRDLWKKYDYRDYGIIGEPYFDIDFEKVLYLTDTGRRWDGDKMSVRDKVGAQSSRFKVQSCPRFRSTFDIIEAAEKGLLPDKIMLNTHPQRWTNNPIAWTRELVWQGVKNQAKRVLVGMRHS